MVARPARAQVVVDLAVAVRLASAGQSVVLIVSPEAPPVDLPAGLDTMVALFVGDPSDPAHMAAAEEMASELFARRQP